MKILEQIFDNVLVLEPSTNTDCRGRMMVGFHEDELKELQIDFRLKEQRVYSIPETGTFFGIHYQDASHPQAKLVFVIQGKGLDYIVDLRQSSATYKQWKSIELTAEIPRIIYIPEGYGHAFLSMKDNTIQMFAIDEYFIEGSTKQINYKDPGIGFKLPMEHVILSDYDKNAPFLA